MKIHMKFLKKYIVISLWLNKKIREYSMDIIKCNIYLLL